MTAADRYPSFRAPQGNREILCVPRWSTLQSLVEAQAAKDFSADVLISGRPLADLAGDARKALLTEAKAYTQTYLGESEQSPESCPFILTGHQPELFHPGVWLKNFAAAKLAESVGGVAINLVIDNDLCRSPSIRVPTGSVEQPQVVDVAFDSYLPEMPYEQREIDDQQRWCEFGKQLADLIDPLVEQPLIAGWWPKVVQSSAHNTKIGYALAQARHRLEHGWGMRSLELPQSKVCQTQPFRQFASHLLCHADEFRTCYNDSLADYRVAHRLRSDAQPLPDLQRIDNFVETPFWIWTVEQPQRRPLFVRKDQSGLVFSDRHQWQATLTFKGDSVEVVRQLESLEQQGIKIRTRALITTMYARLLLSDVFIHGIGGAKYDQVTDDICRRFFGIELPQFVTMSGTLHLPIEHATVLQGHVPELKRKLRELTYHPEKFLDEVEIKPEKATETNQWRSKKRHWVQTIKTKENAAERHAEIYAANLAMQPSVQSLREQIEHKLSSTVSQTRRNLLLESREYAFCLFPHKILQDFLLDFSSGIL